MWETKKGQREQELGQLSNALPRGLDAFVLPLLMMLDEQIDKRFLGMFYRTLQVMVLFRHGRQGL